MYKSIEFVCGGNQGRSPVCLAVARNFAYKKGIGIELLSSGVYVDFAGRISDEDLGKVLARYPLIKGVENGALSNQELLEFQEKRKNAREILKKLEAHETQRRDRELARRGFGEYIKNHVPNQIRYREKTEGGVILLMDGGLSQPVCKIYAGQAHPEITTLPSFIDEVEELPDAILENDEFYSILVDRLINYTEKAMEKAVA